LVLTADQLIVEQNPALSLDHVIKGMINGRLYNYFVAEVTLKVTKPETVANKEALIRLNISGRDLFASKTCDTFEESIDEAVEALEKQLKRHKDKIRSK
jgi:ribosome-associated translation inhibitor RaiA